MIDEKLKAAIEKALAAGCRVQLKRMKDGSVKAQEDRPALDGSPPAKIAAEFSTG